MRRPFQTLSSLFPTDLVTVTAADLRFLFLLPRMTSLAREGAGILGWVQGGRGGGCAGGMPGEMPTWKPSSTHRYQGGTSSILYNMSNLGSVDRDAGGSLVEVPAEPRDSCWGQHIEELSVDTQKKSTLLQNQSGAPSGLSAPQMGAPALPQASPTRSPLAWLHLAPTSRCLVQE